VKPLVVSWSSMIEYFYQEEHNNRKWSACHPDS